VSSPLSHHLSLLPHRYSKFPVVVPSPTPGYHAHYEASYLKTIGSAKDACGPVATQGWMEALLSQNDPTVRGYAATLAAYLEVCLVLLCLCCFSAVDGDKLETYKEPSQPPFILPSPPLLVYTFLYITLGRHHPHPSPRHRPAHFAVGPPAPPSRERRHGGLQCTYRLGCMVMGLWRIHGFFAVVCDSRPHTLLSLSLPLSLFLPPFLSLAIPPLRTHPSSGASSRAQLQRLAQRGRMLLAALRLYFGSIATHRERTPLAPSSGAGTPKSGRGTRFAHFHALITQAPCTQSAVAHESVEAQWAFGVLSSKKYSIRIPFVINDVRPGPSF